MFKEKLMKTTYKYLILGLLLCFVSLPLFSQMYLEIDLNESQNRRNPFADQRSPLEVFRVIERAANDSKVQGIILNIGSINRNRDYLWELRNSLEQFKAKDKNIVAFISNANMDTYKLASVADKIVMDELGYLTILGYSMTAPFAQGTLEKLGIGVREMRFYDYKSAAEMFVRDSMSEADRRQNNDYLDDIFNLTRNILMNARNWTDEEFDAILNRDFFFSASYALNRNLVDYLGRKEAVLKAINEVEGKEISNFAYYGNSGSSLTGAAAYTPSRSGGLFRKASTIAVVYANGTTDMEAGMNALKLSRTIRELANNTQVSAIVIRVNSPGGSAEAADYVNEAVRYAKQFKPVVISMGQVAASGGYWVAMNASHIVANPYTITGSIGIIGSWFYDNGLNDKLGLTTDILKRGASADLMAGLLFPHRDFTVHEEERYKSILQAIYRTFTEKVAAGRDMDIEKVEDIARGRIFSGIRALEVGLVDSIGSFNDALYIAQQLAEIPEGRAVRFEEYPKQTFWDRLSNPFSVLFRILRGNNQTITADFLADIFLPADIRYRIERSGQIMPILPLTLSVY